jgi:hypothetical protein
MTCGVCFELYEIPYRGECGHTICGGCLERLPRTDCPFCRAPLAEPATLEEIAGGTDLHLYLLVINSACLAAGLPVYVFALCLSPTLSLCLALLL